MHAANLEPTKNVLKRYLANGWGAEALFRRKGPSAAAAAAYGLQIGELERDAWLLCMKGALEESVAELRPAGDLRFAREARRLDAQPGRQSSRYGHAASVTTLRWVILPAEFSASRKVFPFRVKRLRYLTSFRRTTRRGASSTRMVVEAYPDLLSAAPHSQNPSSGRPHGCDPGTNDALMPAFSMSVSVL